MVTLSLKDFISSELLKIAILPFVITMIIIYTIFFSTASIVIDNIDNIQIEQTSTNVGGFNNNANDTIVDNIANFFIKSTAISWIINIFIYSIGTIAMLYFSIFISLIVIGFLTPYILAKIRDKHYKDIDFKGDISIVDTILYLLKSIAIMVILFFVLIPFYFIPIINIFAINFPLYYMFHKLLNFDVATTILDKQTLIRFKQIHSKNLRLRTLKLYLLSLIPFMSLILPVYYVVYIGHGYFNELQRNN